MVQNHFDLLSLRSEINILDDQRTFLSIYSIVLFKEPLQLNMKLLPLKSIANFDLTDC